MTDWQRDLEDARATIEELTRERDEARASASALGLRHGATVQGKPGTICEGVVGWVRDSGQFWDVMREGRCAWREYKSVGLDGWNVISPAQHIEHLARELLRALKTIEHMAPVVDECIAAREQEHVLPLRVQYALDELGPAYTKYKVGIGRSP